MYKLNDGEVQREVCNFYKTVSKKTRSLHSGKVALLHKFLIACFKLVTLL